MEIQKEKYTITDRLQKMKPKTTVVEFILKMNMKIQKEMYTITDRLQKMKPAIKVVEFIFPMEIYM